MRLVKVTAPNNTGADIAKIAFSVGIKEVSIQKAEAHNSSGEIESKDAIDVQTSTPKAKRFIDSLLQSDFFMMRKKFQLPFANHARLFPAIAFAN